MILKKAKINVVGIGASAGGLKALQELFSQIPEDTGKAFIIVQHLSPDFKSLMPELLSKYTKMPIFTAKDKQIIKPNCIYLNQRSKNLHIKGSKIFLLAKGPRNNLNLPIDIFFHTLGEEYKEKATAVILSGTGSDGSRGIQSIKEGGGTIIVQDPVDAQFDGMPISAINTNTVDYILDTVGIANYVSRKNSHESIFHEGDFEVAEDVIKQYLKKIILSVYKYSGIDFREYKKSTLLRRIEKRMAINNIRSLQVYHTFLETNDEEKAELRDGFLIGVTRFFRDGEAFKELNKQIIPSIFSSKAKNETVRVWIAGCSTGQEVYSVAILLQDYIKQNKLSNDFKIFATDVDPRGLKVASAGVYSVNIVNDIDKRLVEDYFIKQEDHYKITKQIRDCIVFSEHNLLSDPPFINTDLITCRNLLIYLENDMQQRALQNFQFSLNTNGYLFLGSSESLGNVSKEFKTINTKWKLFQNISKSKYSPYHQTPFTSLKSKPAPHKTIASLGYKEKPAIEEYPFDKFLSKHYSPDVLFIDKEFDILFLKGNAGKKLHHGEGLFQNNLLKIVNEEIAVLIKTGVRRRDKTNKDVIIKNITNTTDNNTYNFDLKIHRPIRDQKLKDYYLIEFSEDRNLKKAEQTIEVSTIQPNESAKEEIQDLERELSIVKSDLQNAIEELETTNEELQSSNEELMAANEELQSTNEELQSVNEELFTVNSEMQEKNKELTNLSNDVINLLDNTEIATIFLDKELKIRKFTPAIKDIFNLEDEDVGRKLSTFTSNFDALTTQQIVKDASVALQKLSTVENQLKDKDGNYYLQRISPFVTSSKTIDGVVITINNINKIKEIEQELAEADEKYYDLFKNLTEGFIHAKIVTNQNGEAVDWEYLDVNPAYSKMLNVPAKKLIGNRVLDFLPELKNDPFNWIKKYGDTALNGKKQTLKGYVSSINKYFYVNIFSPKKGEFAATISDFTELKKKEDALVKSERELNNVQKITNVGSWILDLESGEVKWTEELYNIFGLNPNEAPPNFDVHKCLFTEDSWKKLQKAVENAQNKGKSYKIELEIRKANQQRGWVLAKGEAVKENGTIIKLRGSAQDITKIKENELALIAAKKEAEEAAQANLHKNYFLANMSHEIRTPIASILGFSDLLKTDNIKKDTRIKYIDIIDNNSKQLLNLIDDIIDVSKIESDELKLVYGDCNVADLIENLVLTYDQVKTKRDKSHLVFKPSVPDDLKNLVIHTDPKRLEQVMGNLLNNALKFSKKGTISLGFTQEGDYIKFFVKDEGIGIVKDKQDLIFDRFRQVDYSAEFGGTGLGLSICRSIVTLLGGEIWVNSKYNHGTTFEFTIPLKASKTQAKRVNNGKTRKQDFLKDKSILIAEDNKLISTLLSAQLSKTGAKVTFVQNGLKAVENYKENPNFDVVLLDIRMPVMSGIEAMSEILKINPDAIIIMQTAHAMEEEKQTCFEKGCSDFLSKPIVKEQLLEMLQRWAN